MQSARQTPNKPVDFSDAVSSSSPSPCCLPSWLPWLLSGSAAAAYFAVKLWRRRREKQHLQRMREPITRSEIIFMGTGSSTGVPRATCVTDPHSKCNTCKLAMSAPAEVNPNWRHNPSLLIRIVRPNTDSSPNAPSSTITNIQIDICKTFLPSILRWYPRYGVHSLDAVILTHEHADATLGLDDIRSLQHFEIGLANPPRLPVHVTTHTFNSLLNKFNYLMCDWVASTATAAAAASASSNSPSPPVNRVERKVAQIEWPIMRPFVPFTVKGLEVMPIPVFHGEDYISMGFVLGSGLGKSHLKDPHTATQCCLYVSDVTRIPQVTMDYLFTGVIPSPPAGASESEAQAFFERFNDPLNHDSPNPFKIMPDFPIHPSRQAPRFDVVVVDALFPELAHNTHFNLPQALEFLERLRPKKGFITGMSDLFEYHRDNAELKRRKQAGELHVDVELGCDGLRVPLNL